MVTETELAEYIGKCRGIIDPRLCHVRLATGEWDRSQRSRRIETWLAMNYRQDRGDYIVEQLYCVGALPKSYRRTDTKLCFVPSFGVAEWFVAAHFEGDATEAQPLGPNFILMPWDSNFKIDMHVVKPYERAMMTVTYV